MRRATPQHSGEEQGSDSDASDDGTELWDDLANLRSNHLSTKLSSGAASKTINRTQGASSSSPPQGSQQHNKQMFKADKCSGRTILHLDVDAFYCAVERMDDPSLVGTPLAVRQFNAGGFVAVSYEAKARGIQKGDGVGKQGIANIKNLQDIGAVPLEKALERCPGLQVRPMRTDRYREVGATIKACLEEWDVVVEKASYDDFYCDLSGKVSGPSAAPAQPTANPPRINILDGHESNKVASDLLAGAQLAQEMCTVLKQRFGNGFSCSGGVARSKLLARLASCENRPDGLTVVPDAASLEFILRTPIVKVPKLQVILCTSIVSVNLICCLQGKLGKEIVQQLSISRVGELAKFQPHEIVTRFGSKTAAFVHELLHGSDSTAVQDRGLQKTILVERSFVPTDSEAGLKGWLADLSTVLLQRVRVEAQGRIPGKFVVTWRQGYGDTRMKARSMPCPSAVTSSLRTTGKGADDAALVQGCTAVMVDAAWAVMIRESKQPYQVTRVALSFGFDSNSVIQGQETIKTFMTNGPRVDDTNAHRSVDTPAASRDRDTTKTISKHDDQRRHTPIVAAQATTKVESTKIECMPDNSSSWACGECTFANFGLLERCEMCDAPKPCLHTPLSVGHKRKRASGRGITSKPQLGIRAFFVKN